MDNQAFQPDDNNRPNNDQRDLDNSKNGRPFTIERSSRNDHNEYLVEVGSRAKVFKRPYFYKRLSIVFLLLSVLFFILMIIFIVLYTKSNSKPYICTSNECLRTASNYLSSIDYRVDPCDNFYEFVCGRWSEEHPNHGWWSSFSSFTTISEKVAIASLEALSAESDDAMDEPEAVNKSRNFYKSCMDLDALDDLGIMSVYPILEKINLPIIPTYMNGGQNVQFTFDWLKIDALAKRVLLMDVFIGAAVGPNIFNGSENVLYFGQIYQTSPLPSPLKTKGNPFKRKKDSGGDDAFQELTRAVHSNVIKYVIKEVMLNKTGDVPEETLLQEAADVIIEISDFIDDAVTNTTDPDIVEEDAYPITIDNLEKEVNDGLTNPQKNFLSVYLRYLFNGTNVTITSNDLLYVTDMDVLFLKIVTKYLSEIPHVNIELYMWWASIYAMIINTSDDISEYIYKQLSVFSTESTTVARSRSLECTLLVNNYMGYAMSYVIADPTFSKTTKPKVERMVLGLKEAFAKSVEQLTWMDSKTKKVTLEKSKEMISFIGYPDWLFEKGELDKYYSDVEISPTKYLDNMVNVIVSTSTTNLKSLRVIHKRDWYSEPIEVNAFNSFSDNAINVPMAILNFPMYHLGLEVLNYGSIGSILGHELTHGFDNTGRKHDKYGNYIQWWTNRTIETFENLTECFIKQYDNFTIEDIDTHVNGKKTLGENLADNGGLNQAQRAYENYVKKFGEEPKLPGFENYTSYQIFFVAYASIWCETINVEDLIDQIEYDEHCPNYIRVLGTLQNSEHFATAFHCPVGSPMNPKKKCKIW